MYEMSARYREVIHGSHRAVVRAQLLTTVQFGASPTGGTELPVLDGRVKLSSRSDVKGTLDLTVPGDYWELLQPYGAEVFVERGVDFGDGTAELAPLGYYRIYDLDQPQAPHGPIRITGLDRIACLIDNRTVYPHPYPVSTHRQLAERLINASPIEATDGKRKGYGLYENRGVTVPISWSEDAYNPDTAMLPAGLCEDDVYEHLAKIFDARGCVLRANRHGEFVIEPRDRPPGTPSVLTVGPGAAGTLVRASRKTTRRGVYTMIVTRSSDPEVPVAVGLDYIDDPVSPLRWYGPFGPVVRYYASPLIKTPEGAQAAAETIQARYRGLPTGTGVALVPDPSIDPLDPVTVLVGNAAQAHLVDEVEIPLVVSGEVRITTRALNDVPDLPEEDISTPPPDPGGGGGGEPEDFDADIFVSTTGSDANNGLTEGTAKATLAGGLAAASAGHTIKVMPGVYEGNFVTSKGGSSGNPITIRSATKWGARIEGDGDSDEAAVQISHQYIRLQDFEVCGDDTETCRIGVLVEANNVEVLGNNIHDVCLFPTEGTGYQGGAGIDFGGQTSFSNILVDGNVIHDCGIPDIEQLVHGIYCGVHGTNFRITNNVIYRCQDFGVHPYDETEASGIQIINNTIVGNGRGILQAPNGITRNNISYNNKASNYDIRGSGNTVQNNISGGTGNVSRSGVTSGVNPQFVKYALDGTGDFRLLADSPAVGAGTATGAPDKDIAGVTRPQGSAFDCGAYERVTASDPDPGGGGGGTSPVPSGATSIFAADFEGTLTPFSNAQNKNYNGSASGAGLSAYPLTLVNGGTDHPTACRFEVRSGDVAISGERSELRYPGAVTVAQGDERWFEFDMRFEPGFQGVSTSGWLIVFQLHPNDSVSGSPQLDLTVREDETLRLRLHETAYFTIGSIDEGNWHRYALYVKAHTSNGSALTKVYRDGTEVVSSTDRNLKSGSTSGNYFKTGIYRNSNSFTSILQLDRVRVWTP